MVPGRAHPGSGLPPDSLRRGLRSRSGWADPLGLGLSCPSGPAPPTPVRARQYTGHPPASSLALVPTPRAPYPPSARAASHPVGTTRVGARAAPLPVASFSSISESCSPDPSRVGAREFVAPPIPLAAPGGPCPRQQPEPPVGIVPGGQNPLEVWVSLPAAGAGGALGTDKLLLPSVPASQGCGGLASVQALLWLRAWQGTMGSQDPWEEVGTRLC